METPAVRQTLIDFLVGKETREITESGYDEKEHFGSGESHDEDYWAMVIDAAFERGLLKVHSTKKNDLMPTAAGRKFAQSPKPFVIDDEGEPGVMPQDKGLDEIVKNALDVKIPTGKIASPRTKQQINLIHAIDRKIALDDFAEGESLGFDELLDELEGLVQQGRRLDITYFTNEVMGDDCVSELVDYFTTAHTDNLDQAMQEYGDVYKPEEIRLARIVYRVGKLKGTM